MDFPLLKGLEEVVSRYNQEEIVKYRKSREPAFKSVESFVKDNNRVICGIMAIKNLLDNVKQELDTPNELWYYQVYSPNARKDAILLANRLYNDKFPLIEAKKDFDGSYVVWYKAQKICKFIHVPASLFDRLPTRKSDNNLIGEELLYANIDLLKIPILLSYIDPRQDISSWETIVKYDTKLDSWYPFKTTGHDPGEGTKIYDQKLLQFLKGIHNWMHKEKDLILIGNYAYQKFLETSKYPRPFKPIINFYEVLSDTPEAHIKALEKALGTPLQFKKHESPLDFHGTKYSVFKDNLKLIDIYDKSEQCIPFVEIDKTKYGTYHVILLFLYIGIWISHKIKDTSESTANRLRDRLTKMIWTLIDARNWYLRQRGISGVHDCRRESVFDVFQIHCQGTQKNIEREFRIRKWKGEIKDKLMVVRSYKPELWMERTGQLLEGTLSPNKKKRKRKVKIKQ